MRPIHGNWCVYVDAGSHSGVVSIGRKDIAWNNDDQARFHNMRH